MKKIAYLLVVTFLSLLSWSLSKSERPELKINQRSEKTLTRLILLTENWLDHANQSNVEHQKYYHQIRDAYKSIETYVSFRYPELEKAINGGPVPSITTDVVILHKDDPHGLQVLEEILTDETENLDTETLVRELQLLQKNFEKLVESFMKYPLQVWEVFDANHQIISRMMSLGLTGFDSPGFLRSIRDAQINLQYGARDFKEFEKWGNKTLHDSIQFWYGFAIDFLKEHNDFEALNRVYLYREALIPLQSAIRRWHQSTQYEMYEETGALPRTIQSKALHLFDANYLNPYFTTRGAKHQPTTDQIQLGKLLFFDPILSHSLQMSCSSCHDPNKAYSDGLATSISANKAEVARNSPSLINTGYQGNFFWDLKSDDMNNQIMHVFESPSEFNTTPEEMVYKLSQSTEYVNYFHKAFPGFAQPISMSHIKASLEAFVRSINALNAPFDRYLRKEIPSVDESVIRGANIFMGKAACATCHFAPIWNGFVPPNYEESEGEILGVLDNPNGSKVDADLGRYHLFQFKYPDANYVKGMFKTPGIRNVSITAPYMHNGAYQTLEEVMAFYNHGGATGKGINWPQQTLASDSLHLSDREIHDMIQFMNALTDTLGTHIAPFPLPNFTQKLWNDRLWGGVKTTY